MSEIRYNVPMRNQKAGIELNLNTQTPQFRISKTVLQHRRSNYSSALACLVTRIPPDSIRGCIPVVVYPYFPVTNDGSHVPLSMERFVVHARPPAFYGSEWIWWLQQNPIGTSYNLENETEYTRFSPAFRASDTTASQDI